MWLGDQSRDYLRIETVHQNGQRTKHTQPQVERVEWLPVEEFLNIEGGGLLHPAF